MILKICRAAYSLQWGGVYQLALLDYPRIKAFELERIGAFIAYEKQYKRKIEIQCDDKHLLTKIVHFLKYNSFTFPYIPKYREAAATFNEDGISLTSDFLSHTCTIETAKLIFKEGKILSAVKAFNKPAEVLVNDKRNAAGDPKDYFDYVMLNWSNTNSGYRLVMERLLGKAPSEQELTVAFKPGVSFHFNYQDIINHPDSIFDGYHPAKIKNQLSLAEHLVACVIPKHYQEDYQSLVPNDLKHRVYYLDYCNETLYEWNQKVSDFLCHLENK
ncbi:TPA: phosphate ABC transporter ATPase [Streptococcus agalactiae]|nr:phosphate ABC transporter ATPase [Streptococcus agalactiae]HEO3728958.1 phosphate ABC transporter ATPase [Streptococcus agalactiae]HEO6338963.1 phosphate ABC transporter ATPase [Streptococcus agalactiae]